MSDRADRTPEPRGRGLGRHLLTLAVVRRESYALGTGARTNQAG